MYAMRDYIVFVPGSIYFREYFEALLFERKKVQRQAREAGIEIVYDIVNPNGWMSNYHCNRRQRYLSDVRKGKFLTLMFKGESVTPYVGALLRGSHPSVIVVNQSVPNSQLDFCIQLHELHMQETRRSLGAT